MYTSLFKLSQRRTSLLIKNSENIDTSINKNVRCESECVVPLRKELLSQSEKVYEGVAHRKGHTTTQMSSQQCS